MGLWAFSEYGSGARGKEKNVRERPVKKIVRVPSRLFYGFPIVGSYIVKLVFIKFRWRHFLCQISKIIQKFTKRNFSHTFSSKKFQNPKTKQKNSIKLSITPQSKKIKDKSMCNDIFKIVYHVLISFWKLSLIMKNVLGERIFPSTRVTLLNVWRLLCGVWAGTCIYSFKIVNRAGKDGLGLMRERGGGLRKGPFRGDFLAPMVDFVV